MKVGYNRVHGYYIETSKAAKGDVPEEYIRRQTLKNAERYITPALKTFEEDALRSQSKSLQLERQLFGDLLIKLAREAALLRRACYAIAQTDVLACLAERAYALGLIHRVLWTAGALSSNKAGTRWLKTAPLTPLLPMTYCFRLSKACSS